MKSGYKVIGLMSGTSLDGVDLAFCDFIYENNLWTFKILNAETIKYSSEWREKLRGLNKRNSFEFIQAHAEYGKYLGELAKRFIKKNKIKPGFVSSHGHTIFHQPQKKLTFQLGNGAAIAAECGLTVVCDFRTLDVALGGQGAPLVPIGDKLLFHEYGFCLNIGGISNISFDKNGKRIAFDVCPANIVLNNLSLQLNKEFDKNGEIAAKGKINEKLLYELNRLAYYKMPPPKSLGIEWIEKNIFPLLKKTNIPVEDKLKTFCEHIAVQIAGVTNSVKKSTLLITGGGAHNKYLINRIKKLSESEIIIPEKNIIDFKEALIFAFLGVLRMRNEVNCLKSVTGAERNNTGGTVFLM
ncbi:MAG: anhydro-N-acetylmuramic acid kinase [Bacteroidales bacterium]|nr:anhydro-N-acetylmuramic acid kinase [Bacteroidales bacterium]